MSYDTSEPEGLGAAAAFVKGWLESREDRRRAARPSTGCRSSWPTSGRATAPTVILHGHLDVVPAREGQFTPRIEGDRLIGRGAYDMKGALAVMLCARGHGRAGPRPRALPVRPRRGVRGRRRTARPTRWSRDGLRGRLRPHRRADRPAHRRPGQGRARGPRRGRGRRPRLDAVARATTRSSRPTTSSAASRRCPSAASPPTSSTGRRSTSRASWAATPSTRSPTSARWTSTSASCPTRTRARSSPDPRDRRPRRSSSRSSARRRSSRAATPTSAPCATRSGARSRATR